MLDKFDRYPLTFGPTPIEKLERLSAHLGGGVDIYAKREDCNSGLAFGGNKVRKLEYIVPDAIASGADTLVTVNAQHGLDGFRTRGESSTTLPEASVTVEASATHLGAILPFRPRPRAEDHLGGTVEASAADVLAAGAATWLSRYAAESVNDAPKPSIC